MKAAFVRQSRFCRIRGALSTLIRHGKRATFPKGEGKGKMIFGIENTQYYEEPFFHKQRVGHGA